MASERQTRSERLQLARRADHAHALAAAAGRRLDEHRVADPLRLAQGVQVVAEHPVGARDRRQAVVAQQLARAGLAGEPLQHGRRRADERQVVGGHDLGEALVLGQEAVAGVDGVAAGHERGRDDRRGRQVRAGRVGRADADGLVGELDGERLAVRLAVGDDRLHAERRQARRMRRAISPRLAMRTLRNTVDAPPTAGGRRVGAATDIRRPLGGRTLGATPRSRAAPGRTRPRRPTRRGWTRRCRRSGASDLLGDAEHVHGAEPVTGADAVARPSGRVRGR